MADERVRRKIPAILSGDVAGYSRLMERDEEATVRTVSAGLLWVDGGISNIQVGLSIFGESSLPSAAGGGYEG